MRWEFVFILGYALGVLVTSILFTSNISYFDVCEDDVVVDLPSDEFVVAVSSNITYYELVSVDNVMVNENG